MDSKKQMYVQKIHVDEIIRRLREAIKMAEYHKTNHGEPEVGVNVLQSAINEASKDLSELSILIAHEIELQKHDSECEMSSPFERPLLLTQ